MLETNHVSSAEGDRLKSRDSTNYGLMNMNKAQIKRIDTSIDPSILNVYDQAASDASAKIAVEGMNKQGMAGSQGIITPSEEGGGYGR